MFLNRLKKTENSQIDLTPCHVEALENMDSTSVGALNDSSNKRSATQNKNPLSDTRFSAFDIQSRFATLGATVLEMTIATLVVVFLLLSFFDWARYQTARLIMHKGAEDALNVAKTDEGIAVDTRTLDLSNPVDQEELGKYQSAITEVVQTALSLPKKTFIYGSNEEGMIKLKPVVLPSGVSADVTVLRPGERVELNSQGSGVFREHPTMCSANAPEGADCPDRINENDSMRDVLLNNPLVVEMQAEVKPLSPWLPVMNINVSVKGFKEQAQHGVYPKKPGQEFTTTTVTTSTTTTVVNCAEIGASENIRFWVPCEDANIGQVCFEEPEARKTYYFRACRETTGCAPCEWISLDPNEEEPATTTTTLPASSTTSSTTTTTLPL